LAETPPLLIVDREGRREDSVIFREPGKRFSGKHPVGAAVLALVKGKLGIVPLEAQVSDHLEVLLLLIDTDDLVHPDPDTDLEWFVGCGAFQRLVKPFLKLRFHGRVQ